MTHKFEYNKHTYWIMVMPTIHDSTKEKLYISYIRKGVNPITMGELVLSESVRDNENNIISFADALTALETTKIIIQDHKD